MSIKRMYLKSRPVCKVTFEIAEGLNKSAKEIRLVGEFNDWSALAHPMKRLKNGVYSTTIDLMKGTEYQFRYLVDGSTWENEPESDKFVPTPYGNSENSVLIT